MTKKEINDIRETIKKIKGNVKTKPNKAVLFITDKLYFCVNLKNRKDKINGLYYDDGKVISKKNI